MLKALVIEDRSDWQKVITKAVEREGCQTVQVSTYSDARKILESDAEADRDFALIILDLRLDERTDKFEGMELLTLTDERWQEDGTRVIIVTAYGTAREARNALKQHRVSDFISKSDSGMEFIDEFQSAIEAALEEYKVTKEKRYRALVIEDDPAWQRTITKLLKKEGYEVFQVTTEESAVTFLEDKNPQYRNLALIVLDLRLNQWAGGFEGMSLLELTNWRWIEDKTSVLIVTAYGWVAQAQATIPKFPQVYDFIPKTDPTLDFSEYFLKTIREISKEFEKN